MLLEILIAGRRKVVLVLVLCWQTYGKWVQMSLCDYHAFSWHICLLVKGVLQDWIGCFYADL